MAPKLVRCIEGHVFDAQLNIVCPVCGAPAPQRATSEPISELVPESSAPTSGANSSGKAAQPFPRKRVLPWLIGGGAGVIALLIFAANWTNRDGDISATPKACCAEPKLPEPKEQSADVKPRPASENTDAAPRKKIHINPDAIRLDDTTTPPLEPKAAAPAELPAAQTGTQPQQPPANSQDAAIVYPPAQIKKIETDLKLSNTVVDIAQFKQYWSSYAAKPDRGSLAALEAVTLAAGTPQGAFALYNAYSRGLGTNIDNGAALKFLRMAVNLHYAPAMMTLGTLNQFGRLGVPQNTDAAREFYRQAARQGSDEALQKFTALGGDPKSIKPTSPELIELAWQGKRSMVNPAMKASEEKVLGADCALAIYSIQTNNKKATPELIQVLEQEARLGVGDAPVYLAQIYEGGYGIEANRAEALAWNGIIYTDLTEADLKKAVGDTISDLASKLSSTDFDSLMFVEPWLGPFKPGVLR